MRASMPPGAVREVARVFGTLGIIAFGGPAAHIALMREEIVRRRRWVSDERFVDLLGMTNLIPGPNSTEMAIHLGYARAGWGGLVAAGVAFILPAMLIVLALARAYVTYGTVPQAVWLLYGIKPVIIAVVVHAIWGLLRSAITTSLLAAVGGAAFALYLAGAHELAVLFGSGLTVALARQAGRWWRAAAVALIMAGLPGVAGAETARTAGAGLGTLFLLFLKIGSVLYGSGYVLLAFLRSDFVDRYRWLTDQQLLDAVSIGQFTPGPVFTTATFIGYLIAGWPGALLATLGIFLPSFVFVAISHPLIPRIRASRWTASILDGVNAAALGLMAAVTLELGRAAVVDWLTVVLALTAAVLLIRFKVNSAWLVLAGAAAGIAYGLAVS
jgi:chromate transporter